MGLHYTIKISVTLRQIWRQLSCHLNWRNLSIALRAVFCLIVPIRKIATAITGRNFLTFITREMLASSCFSRKANCKCTPKGVAAQLPPLLVLTYTYFLQCICIRHYITPVVFVNVVFLFCLSVCKNRVCSVHRLRFYENLHKCH